MNSRVTVCLARLKKRHKCKFVPRLLSMIVGVTEFNGTVHTVVGHPWNHLLRKVLCLRAARSG